MCEQSVTRTNESNKPTKLAADERSSKSKETLYWREVFDQVNDHAYTVLIERKQWETKTKSNHLSRQKCLKRKIN